MKNKTLYIAKLNIRSEAVDGGAVPDDEMQADFIISTGDVDGHGSIMTEKTLQNYTADAKRGVPFMLEHGEGVNLQIGRTIAATYDEAQKQVIATVSMLRDTDDTPDNMKVNEYIRRVERGYYDSVSVAFRDATETCNICGKEIFDFHRDNPCPHIPKRAYNGEICTYNVDGAYLREVSLVASGSNPNAKLLDTRTWDENLRKVKAEGDNHKSVDDQKSLLEKDGIRYRNGLITVAIQEGVRAEDDFDETKWRKRFDTMDSEQIIDQTHIWSKLGDARWGEGGRKTGNPNPQNSGDAIVLPSYLFEY